MDRIYFSLKNKHEKYESCKGNALIVGKYLIKLKVYRGDKMYILILL